MTADHVIPYRNGGRARADNIVAACASYNSSRPPRNGRYTTGNNTPSSPFEVLQTWKALW
jgi:5-methylcytosine-specific restriction endonuclease McrA